MLNPVSIMHNVSILNNNYSTYCGKNYTKVRLKEKKNTFYLGINGLLVKILFSTNLEAGSASKKILFDKIDYSSTTTDLAGNITLHCRLHRSKKNGAKKRFSTSKNMLKKSTKNRQESFFLPEQYSVLLPPKNSIGEKITRHDGDDTFFKELTNLLPAQKRMKERCHSSPDLSIWPESVSHATTLDMPVENTSEIPNPVVIHANLKTEITVNKLTKINGNMSLGEIIKDAKQMNEDSNALATDADPEHSRLLCDARNTWHRIYALVDDLHLAAGNQSEGERAHRLMKSDLREMLREFSSTLNSSHPWPSETKNTCLMLMADITRSIDQELITPVVVKNSPVNTSVLPKKMLSHDLKNTLKLASSYARTGNIDHAPDDVNDLKLNRSNIIFSSRINPDPGEFKKYYLIRYVKKIQKRIHILQSKLDDVTSNNGSVKDNENIINRTMLRDFNNEVDDFVEHWSQAGPSDKLLADSVFPFNEFSRILVGFKNEREKINTLFDINYKYHQLRLRK